MIVFKNIKWKNFLSTGNVYTEIPLNKHTTTLIMGENGAGKSTLLDALTFALFGKPYRDINKPQLVNSINGKECLVELSFQIGEKKYLIRRGIKPAIFEIWVDGDMLDQSASLKDYQDILEKMILKMNYKSFTQIVILGSASFTPFMQLSASDRRAVIEDLLDIQIFSTMNALVKERVSSLKEIANETSIRLGAVKEKIDLHAKHLEELKKNNQDIIDARRDEMERNGAEIDKVRHVTEKTQDEIDELMQSVADSENVLYRQKKLDGFTIKLETNKGKLEKEIEFYANNDQCPTCKQDIEKIFKEVETYATQKKIEEIEQGLIKLEEEKNAVLQRISTIRETNSRIADLQRDIATHSNTISHLQKRNSSILTEIAKLESSKAISGESKEQSEKLMTELTGLIEKKKTTAEEKQYYDVAAQLLKDGGIKAKIIKQYLPVINKMVNKYLSSMDFFVNFTMDEEFKETIKSRHRDDFSYANFSEGEKQKIDLSLLLTWRAVARIKNSVNTNLLILDETFDSSLDSKGTDSLLQILYTMPENTNVFVISHKDQLHDKFAHSYRFEKKQNFSRLVV